MHFEHINLSAPREIIEKIKDFYCGIFALDVGFRPDFTHFGYWLYKNNKALVHLTESNSRLPNGTQGYFDHIAFQLEGINHFIDRLRRNGVDYTVNYVSQTKTTQVFFKDPAGIRLEATFLGEALT